MLWFLLIFLIFSFLQRASAQSDASCLPFYNWTFNTQNETPCQVASSLLAVCNNGPFPVVALLPNTHYVGPTLENATPCQCNTVTYSLMSACGACQGRTYLSWSVWTTNCAMVYTDTYPESIPSGLSVPGWAYLDVEAEDNFDQTNARNNANLTESIALPSPTSSSVPSNTETSKLAKTTPTSSKAKPSSSSKSTALGTSTSSTVTSSALTAASSTSSVSDTKANALGGGLVGGLFGFAILCGVSYWYIHRRRRIAQNGRQLPSPVTSPTDVQWPVQGQGPYMAQVTAQQAPVASSHVSGGQAPYNLDSSIYGSVDTVPAGHAHV